MQGIITEPRHILGELVASKDSGREIGIWAPSLGPGSSMCAVESIVDDDYEHDKVIILRDRDARGNLLPSHVLLLQEIEKVFTCPPRDDRPAQTSRGGPNGMDTRRR